jgi:hypothetical protein
MHYGPRTIHERLWHAPSWRPPAADKVFDEVVIDYQRLTWELGAMEVLVVALYLTWAKPTDGL